MFGFNTDHKNSKGQEDRDSLALKLLREKYGKRKESN